MNKKFLSAILFGALMVTSTGTFVSCKDYDDDIENLQTQINNLATKSDVEAKLSQLQAAIDAAKAEAMAAAKAADESAEIAALEAEIAALETCKCDVDAMMAKIQDAVDADMAEFKEEIDALIEKAEKLVGEVADYVTSVDLILESVENGSSSHVLENQTLNMMTIEEKENVFGKDLPGEITFVKGTQRQVGASFYVRVSPTNAVLTPEMISLVNAQGENLDEFLTVQSVSKYANGIWGDQATPQTRAAANTGLWKVTVALKAYDKDNFNATVMDKFSDGNYYYKKFAVTVNNTLSTAASREVISQYGLQINKIPFAAVAELNYWVGNKNVTTIFNRYETTMPNGSITTKKEELTWIAGAATAAARNSDGSLKTGAGANAVAHTADNRSPLSYIYPAVQGKKFTISIDKVNNTNANAYSAPSQVKAMYVTLDTRNAVESTPSEINAWKSYTYTGLDQVVLGTSAEISIDGTNVIDDIIGFRVYAVNYDGTLVDPDGRAFYVRLGNVAANWSAINTTIIPDPKQSTVATEESSDKIAATLTNLTGAASATWTTTKIGNNAHVFDAIFVDADGKTLYSTADLNKWPADYIANKGFKNVAKIYTKPTVAEWYKYVDNKTYEGKLVIKNANDFVLATLDVTMTKELPTVPAGYSIKTGQKNAEGIYNCYLTPDNWVAPNAANGTMEMSHVFNWGEKNVPAQYTVTFAASNKNSAGNLISKSAAGNATYSVDKGYIDNKTEHSTVVTYNYGPISSAQYEAYVADPQNVSPDYVVKVDEFPTVYSCIYNNTYSWKWATIEDMAEEYEGDWAKKNDDGTYKNAVPATSFKYGEVYKFKTPAGAEFGFDQAIQGVSERDGRYSAMLWAPYEKSLKYVEGHVITKANNEVDEYFKVAGTAGNLYFEPTQVSTNTNPTTEVPSTLQLKYKDMYNHDVVIELDVTILPR